MCFLNVILKQTMKNKCFERLILISLKPKFTKEGIVDAVVNVNEKVSRSLMKI